MSRQPADDPIANAMERPLPLARACGSCQLCCFVTPVDSAGLKKPGWTRCRHQRRRGCRIYKRRPQACVSYSCAWLAGKFEECDSPHETGLVLELFMMTSPAVEGRVRIVLAIEARESVLEDQLAIELLRQIQAEGYVLLVERFGKNGEAETYNDVNGRYAACMEHAAEHGAAFHEKYQGEI